MKSIFGVQILCLLVCWGLVKADDSSKAKQSASYKSIKMDSRQWRESRGLATAWPQLRKEKIESITFCAPDTNELIAHCNGYKELPMNNSFRWRNENDIKIWRVEFSVPKANLPECVQIIDKGVRQGLAYHLWPDERMLIVTNKGKYITWVQTELTNTDQPGVFAQDWGSCELGRFLAKYCRPDLEYKYVLPPKEDVVAILLYSREKSPPLAFFGDKRMAQKLIFEPNVKDDPKGIKGIAKLYKFGRICQFGVETREEKGKFFWDNELKPKKTFEGREWLEKIMDAFDTALKEAKKKGKYYPGTPDSFNARIVFMTRGGDCWKEIIVGKTSVSDDYIESGPLKTYFDQIGLTKLIK